MKTNPWAGGLRDEIEAKVRHLNEVADPTERFSEPQVQAIVFLCVEAINKERETFLPMLERYGAALRSIVDSKPATCAEEPKSSAAWFMYSGKILRMAQAALDGSPSGSEGE